MRMLLSAKSWMTFDKSTISRFIRRDWDTKVSSKCPASSDPSLVLSCLLSLGVDASALGSHCLEFCCGYLWFGRLIWRLMGGMVGICFMFTCFMFMRFMFMCFMLFLVLRVGVQWSARSTTCTRECFLILLAGRSEVLGQALARSGVPMAFAQGAVI